jgi:uncharacterized membrane protein
MSWLEFLLFAHIVMAIAWVGGGLMMQFFGLRAMASGDPERFATFGSDVEWIANRVLVPGSILAFVTGVLLVVESEAYGFGDDWIVIALVLYATTFLAGLIVLGPEAGRLGKLPEGSPEAVPRRRRLILLSRLDLVLLFLIVYDMAVKPEFGETSLILWGLAGAAVAAGLLVWRHVATAPELAEPRAAE